MFPSQQQNVGPCEIVFAIVTVVAAALSGAESRLPTGHTERRLDRCGHAQKGKTAPKAPEGRNRLPAEALSEPRSSMHKQIFLLSQAELLTAR